MYSFLLALVFFGHLALCWRGLAYINTYLWHCLESLAKQCVHDKWSISVRRKTAEANLSMLCKVYARKDTYVEIVGNVIFEWHIGWHFFTWNFHAKTIAGVDSTLGTLSLRCLCVCKSSIIKQAWPCTRLHPKGLHMRDGYCIQCILFYKTNFDCTVSTCIVHCTVLYNNL